MTLLEKIKAHPMVESIHEEDPENWGDDNNGHDYWVYLKDGFWSPDMECGTIHEQTLREVWRLLKYCEKEPKQDCGCSYSVCCSCATGGAPGKPSCYETAQFKHPSLVGVVGECKGNGADVSKCVGCWKFAPQSATM